VGSFAKPDMMSYSALGLLKSKANHIGHMTGSINPKFDLFQRFDSQSEKHCYHNEARTSRGNLIYNEP